MKINEYISKLCFYLGLNEESVETNIDEDDEKVNINLEIPLNEAGYFIGNNGEALFALERQLRMVFRNQGNQKRIFLDINNYRGKRNAELEQEVKVIAKDVLETKESYCLEGLNAYERYLVHSLISSMDEFKDLNTTSEGEDPHRILTIMIKE